MGYSAASSGNNRALQVVTAARCLIKETTFINPDSCHLYVLQYS